MHDMTEFMKVCFHLHGDKTIVSYLIQNNWTDFSHINTIHNLGYYFKRSFHPKEFFTTSPPDSGHMRFTLSQVFLSESERNISISIGN